MIDIFCPLNKVPKVRHRDPQGHLSLLYYTVTQGSIVVGDTQVVLYMVIFPSWWRALFALQQANIADTPDTGKIDVNRMGDRLVSEIAEQRALDETVRADIR